MSQAFLSLKQVQQAFDLSKSFIYQLRREGKIRFYYLNSKPFVKTEDLEKVMQPEEGVFHG